MIFAWCESNNKVMQTGISKTGDDLTIVKKQFPVTGMSCASCAASVEATLNHQPGVSKATINFATQTAQVEYNPAVVHPQQLKERVQSIGYDMITDESKTAKDELEEKQKKNSGH